MSMLTELLGSTLLVQGGERKETSAALAGKGAVALYFSAHWCPPCRGFTPQLAEWYKSKLSDKGLEVVFVSSDRDEGAFKEYFGEMPWLALPYEDRDAKDRLSKKFKVQGIPSMVILDADGKTITTEGRAAVSSDPTGEDFPWKPIPPKELLGKAKLINAGGEVSLSKAIDGKKAVLLYFSAHWCPPCRGFTPMLADWYKSNLSSKGLEVIFVSSDKDENQFKEYFAEMPWLALEYSDRKLKEQLSKAFGVSGIPGLVILDTDLNLITKEGRSAISADPEGNELPWHPKPVKNLKSGPGDINETPTVIAFCETSTVEEQKEIEVVLAPIAEKYIQKAKESEEDLEFSLTMATDGSGLVPRIRSMLGLPSFPPPPHEHPLEKKESVGGWYCDGCGCGGEGKDRYRCSQGCDFDYCGECNAKTSEKPLAMPPRLALIDIPSDGAYYLAPEGAGLGTSEVEQFLADYEAGKLERKQLG
jgi:nucleoredoxin